MRILYKSEAAGREHNGALTSLGVDNCYFKQILECSDSRSISKKRHHHTGYEIHIVTEGEVRYEIGEDLRVIGAGEFLLIPPRVMHMAIPSSSEAKKYSISFSKNPFGNMLPDINSAFIGKCTDEMKSCVDCINAESGSQSEASLYLCECRIAELIVRLFASSGAAFDKRGTKSEIIDPRVGMAKQYIDDNIELAPSVEEVASYCCLGEKQIGRLFLKHEGVTPLEYISKRRAERIEKLIVEGGLSLREISEKMSFNNEYYFNAFFKKHIGMTPGAYKKMTK